MIPAIRKLQWEGCPEHAYGVANLHTWERNKRTDMMLEGLLRDCALCRASLNAAAHAYAAEQTTPAKLRTLVKAAQAYTRTFGPAWWFDRPEREAVTNPHCPGMQREDTQRTKRWGVQYTETYHDETYHDETYHDETCCFAAALSAWNANADTFSGCAATATTQKEMVYA